MGKGVDVGGGNGARDGCRAGGAAEAAPRGLRGCGGGTVGHARGRAARKNLPKFRHRPRVRPRSQRAGSGGAAMALLVARRMRVLGACGARGRAHHVGEHQCEPSTPPNSILAPGAAPRRQPTARGVPETPPAMRRRGAEARWVRE